MEGIPTELTRRYLIEHADYALVSSHQQWRTWIWRHHVLLDLTGKWEQADYPHYFKEFWSIFCERRRICERVFFVVDITDLDIQDEAFRGHVKNRWLPRWDREDLVVCFVEAREMKRVIRRAILQLLGIEDRIHLFASHEQALEWVRKCLPASSRFLRPERGGCS